MLCKEEAMPRLHNLKQVVCKTAYLDRPRLIMQVPFGGMQSRDMAAMYTNNY